MSTDALPPAEPKPESPLQAEPAQEAVSVTDSPTGDAVPVQATVATTGKREAFRNIRRELDERDLASPGVQKLLLAELEMADERCAVLEGYSERFHNADKRAAVLEEKSRTNTAFEILFVVGVGLGCAMMGLAPVFWDKSIRGPVTLAVGALFVVLSTIARIFKQ